MTVTGIWEKIFLHSLEIQELDAESDESIRRLCEHLSTIDILIPEGLEPDADFELYVMSKLCRHTEALLSACLKNKVL
jgi:hypothetical protein